MTLFGVAATQAEENCFTRDFGLLIKRNTINS
jgi:hypothetical protein